MTGVRLRGAGGQRAGLAGRLRVMTGALVLAAALAAGCSTATGPAAGGPGTAGTAAARLADCGARPQARPGVVVILCADGGIVAHRLRWSGWGDPVTTAAGTAVVNTCEYNDCHTGSYRSYPIVVVLSRLSACPGGRRGYRRLQYMFVGPSPFTRLPPTDKTAPVASIEGGAGGPATVPGMAQEPGCG